MKIIAGWYHLLAKIRLIVFKILFGNRLIIGRKTTWRKGFSILVNKGAKIKIGKNCFFNNYCSLTAMKLIEIGNGTLMGENVKLYDHNHRFRYINKPIKEQGYSVDEIKIGKHCWIGSNVVILKGTHIGNNCVIGAGCVVSGEIPDNTILKLTNNNQEKVKLNPR